MKCVGVYERFGGAKDRCRPFGALHVDGPSFVGLRPRLRAVGPSALALRHSPRRARVGALRSRPAGPKALGRGRWTRRARVVGLRSRPAGPEVLGRGRWTRLVRRSRRRSRKRPEPPETCPISREPQRGDRESLLRHQNHRLPSDTRPHNHHDHTTPSLPAIGALRAGR